MAEAELKDAAAWYDERSPGLGLRFVLAVRKKSDEILESPQRWPLAAGYREISAEEIEIVAVAHLKRRVSYWGGR